MMVVFISASISNPQLPFKIAQIPSYTAHSALDVSNCLGLYIRRPRPPLRVRPSLPASEARLKRQKNLHSKDGLGRKKKGRLKNFRVFWEAGGLEPHFEKAPKSNGLLQNMFKITSNSKRGCTEATWHQVYVRDQGWFHPCDPHKTLVLSWPPEKHKDRNSRNLCPGSHAKKASLRSIITPAAAGQEATWRSQHPLKLKPKKDPDLPRYELEVRGVPHEEPQ